MSATAYLLVCRSTVDGRALGIDVFSEPTPTTCGPVRWTLAERPYAQTTGVDYEAAVLRLRRSMRRDPEPWPPELLEHAQQFLKPLDALAPALDRYRTDAPRVDLDPLEQLVEALDWQSRMIDRCADSAEHHDWSAHVDELYRRARDQLVELVRKPVTLHAAQRKPTLAERFLAESPPRTLVGDRVDAWLDAHAGWLAVNTDASKLAGQWREVCRRYGAESAPALGVLLWLVRLAFSDPLASSSATSPARWVCRVGGLDETCNEVLLEYRGASEAAALVAALEDAPC